MRPKFGFMPNLKTINRVPVDQTDIGMRTKEKKLLSIMDKIWRVCGTYRLVKPGKMDEEPCFYITDEVGNAINHSDAPNVKMAPLIFSPNCEHDDDKAMTYSVMWPIEKIKKEHYIERDYLDGIDEKQWRSARLYPWFNVFDEYYAAELKKFKDLQLDIDAHKIHEKIQEEYPCPSAIEWDVNTQGPITVYSDYDVLNESLTDPRFKIVKDPKEAKVLYLTEDYEQKNFLNWEINYDTTYVNFFKKEGAIVIKSHVANLVNTTLKDRSCIMESHDLATQLPIMIGSYLEKQKLGEDNTWIIKPTSMARSMDTWVTKNIE